MNKQNNRLSTSQAIWLGLALALCAVLMAVGGTSKRAEAETAAATPQVSFISPDVTCPGGQCFTDVPPANGFYTNINALYQDGIIGGYACGGSNEPCDDDNRPYYRPGNTVTRQQMSKFVDLGRRNIADALGTRLVMTNTDNTQVALVISSTVADSIDVNNSSGAEPIQSKCTRDGANCWAFYSSAGDGNFAGVFGSGRGVRTQSASSSYPALDAFASGASSYGSSSASQNYRGAYVKSSSNGFYSSYVDTEDGPTQTTAGLFVNGGASVAGNLYVSGSKTGYVVDIMQNAGTEALEAGDVVTIVGNSSAVLGQIPVVTVKKTTTAYDTGIVGIVDQMMYVPDAATKAAYDKQEADRKAAMEARSNGMSTAIEGDSKFDPSSITVPDATITDEQGTLHADATATQAQPGGYLSAVTLGSYKAVKVDASFGAIKPGDLLVASTHAGYAMKADEGQIKFGSVIGKALGALDSGTGTVPVMVSLK